MIASLTQYRGTLVSIRESLHTEPDRAEIDRAIDDVDRTLKRLNDTDAKISGAADRAEAKGQAITDAGKDIAAQAQASAQSIRDLNKSYQDNVVATDRKSTRLNSSHSGESRMPSSA